MSVPRMTREEFVSMIEEINRMRRVSETHAKRMIEVLAAQSQEYYYLSRGYETLAEAYIVAVNTRASMRERVIALRRAIIRMKSHTAKYDEIQRIGQEAITADDTAGDNTAKVPDVNFATDLNSLEQAIEEMVEPDMLAVIIARKKEITEGKRTEALPALDFIADH